MYATDPFVDAISAILTRAGLADGVHHTALQTLKGRAVPDRPVPDHVRRSVAALAAHTPDSTRAAFEAIGDLLGGFDWAHSYPPSQWSIAFWDRNITGTLAGPGAPVPSEEVAAGVYLIDPHVHYPAHGHPAHEFYMAVAGDGTFVRDGMDVPLRDGAVTVQEPDVVHAASTDDLPLLVAWCWVGDLRSPIWALDDNGRRFTPPRNLFASA